MTGASVSKRTDPSADIIEPFTLTGALDRYNELLTSIKHYLAKQQSVIPFEPYKFLGDGWILLFPGEPDGRLLLKFLRDFCDFFRDEFARIVVACRLQGDGTMITAASATST